MPKVVFQNVIARLRLGVAQPTDGELLADFVTTRDESAFAELVRRHGPKVYAVCQRVLQNHQLAEDAYQATFLVLTKKAHFIQPRSAVGGFLYGVARKAALEALAVSRRRKEIGVVELPEISHETTRAVEPDVLTLLDEEIANLSETYRAAVVLCELDGVSRAEAAKQLGIAEGTLSSRLAAARKRLAVQLKKRGVVFSLSLFAALAESASATLPPLLHHKTIAPTATIIADGVLRTMLISKLKLTTLGAVLLLCLGISTVVPKPVKEISATPVPKEAKADEYIWVHERKANRLVAYTPSGEVAQRIDLPEDQTFMGLTPDGSKILYAAKSGDKQSYYIRPLGSNTTGTELKLDYSSFDSRPFWNRAGTQFIRRRGEDPKKVVGVRSTIFTYDVFDLQTQTVTRLETPSEHWVLGFAPDQKHFVTISVAIPSNGELFLTSGKAEPKPLPRVGAQVLAHAESAAGPDGRTILLGGVTRTPPKQPWYHGLWKMDIVTGDVTELSHEEGHGYTTAYWSPDGKNFAMEWGYTKDPTSSNGWDETRLTIAKLNGTNRTTITLRAKAKGEDINDCTLLGWFPAKPEPKIDPEAEKLVLQLGAPLFRDREAAEQKLLDMPTKAIPAARAGMQHHELEISQRCKKLLPELIRRDMLRLDHPAWKRFSTIVRDDKAGRSLYVEMIAHTAQSQRLTEMEQNLEQAPNIYAAELKLRVAAFVGGLSAAEKRNVLRTGIDLPDSGILTKGEYLTLLFLGCYPGTGSVSHPESDQRESMHHHNMFWRSIPAALKDPRDPLCTPMRRLYAAWVKECTHPTPLSIGLRQSLSFSIMESLPHARRLAKDIGTEAGIRGLAVLCVGQMGTKEDAPLLEACLGDSRVFHNTHYAFAGGEKAPLETLVGDLALAALLKQIDKHPADYGYPVYGWMKARHADFLVQYQSLCFSTVTQRANARQQTKELLQKSLPVRKVPTAEQIKTEFLRQAGDSVAAVALFDRIRENKYLYAILTEAVQYPHRKSELYATELWRVWREAAKGKDGGVPALDAALCLYLGSDPNTANAFKFVPDPADATDGFRTHETILLSTHVNMELFTKERKAPFGQLLAGWAAARSDPWVRGSAIESARTYRLEAMLPLARRMVTNTSIGTHFRKSAITLLADLGGKNERAVLRTLLSDASECEARILSFRGEDAPTVTAHIRDIALGCLIVLEGVDVRDYGFDELNYLHKEPLKPHEYFRLAPFGFSSDANRKKTFQKAETLLNANATKRDE